VVILLAVGVGRAAVPSSVHDRRYVPHATPGTGGAPVGGAPAGAPVGGGSPRTKPPTAAAKLLGQRIMVGFPGTSAPPSLLSAARRGAIGSVILFSGNVGSSAQLKALTSSLQRAARQGGNPPLLIAVDQEGGEVKRLSDGPPTLSPPQIAATHSPAVASSQGRATGRYLKARGINMDLAPVVDVPTGSRSFIAQQGRAFSSNPNRVSKLATAFAVGAQSAGIAATAKHFPGLGSAPIDTDNQLQELHPTARQRAGALEPYRSLIAHHVDAIMVSVAGFPAYDRSGTVAALSKPIVQGLLRGQLGYSGVTISDSLGAPTGHDEITAGTLAAQAGTDILLFTDSAPGELAALERAFTEHKISRSQADASYERIIALKGRVARS
jgi:beta-N-acetylhexosaminidase